MNLIVDIGNTFVKTALFHEGELIRQSQGVELTDEGLEVLLDGKEAQRAILCSTRKEYDDIERVVKRHAQFVMRFTPQTKVPIGNDYLTPETLGRDRLAAAVGAVELFPDRDLLVIDCGTAITIDLVTRDRVFRGGCISLGLYTRFEALHHFTSCLPLCDPTDEEKLVGRSTQEAIEQGVMNSVEFELKGYIARLSDEFDNLCVIFTGGDAKFFVKRIKNAIFAECNLVFSGLDRILEYNVREE